MDYLFDPRNYRWLLDLAAVRFLVLGFGINIAVASVAGVLSVVVAAPLALLRLRGRPVVRWVTGAWVDLWRNLPTVLIVLYVAIATPKWVQDAIASYLPGWVPAALRSADVLVGIAGLTLYYSALLAEVYRAAINAVPRGQAEATAALGMSDRDSLRFIIAPQGVRAMMPALISQIISLVKNSTLISIIAVPEALRHAQILANSAFSGSPPVPLLHEFVFTGLLFISVNLCLSRIARPFETTHTIGQADRKSIPCR
jgi:ABC-type amino acid transport system permease subunit